MNNPENISIRAYAHIGDAVYEVFARQKVIFMTSSPEKLHKLTVSIVNAEFQAILLQYLEDFLDEEEKEIQRRARNLSVTTARRTNQKLHRLSTAFEAIIGYLYLVKQDRLQELYNHITPCLEEKLQS